jgi:hypothetical protein
LSQRQNIKLINTNLNTLQISEQEFDCILLDLNARQIKNAEFNSNLLTEFKTNKEFNLAYHNSDVYLFCKP